ncbi:lysophospholipid acyltransferase family protein [Salinisphaera sp. USBA-960]|nr:lysophospholipid acyltransferase family protein [Salifodinibacter halophilus]NNC26742.1 lysophospholipid acyltransferase family protein [Salifodinibacter halophilus]
MGDFYFVPAGKLNLSDKVRRWIWRFEAALIGAGLRVFRWLPFRAGRWLAEKSFAALGMYNRRAKNARRNLSVAFADTSPRVIRGYVRRTFGHLGQAMAELAHLDKIWATGRVSFELAPGANQPSSDRPTVFVTAHVGAWEFTPLVARHFNLEIPVIYSPERNPYVDAQLNELRGVYKSELVANRGGLLSFIRALRAGKSVGMTADTRLKGAPDVPFFGHDAPTNTGPAWLAERYGVDLVPVLGERVSGGCYRVTIFAPIVASDPDAVQSERVHDMTHQINRVFEHWIHERPGEWLCLKSRWNRPVYRQLGIET